MGESKILKKINDIKYFLDGQWKKEEYIGVLSDLGGISLFYFIYSKQFDNENAAEEGMSILSESVKRIQRGYNLTSYCAGIAGLCWVIEFLNENDYIEGDENIFSEVDDFIYRSMLKDCKENNFDFLHGAIGHGIYFLKRYKNTNRTKEKEKYKEYLEYLLEFLSGSGIVNGEGIKWESKVIMNEKEEKVYNFGLAHGIPAILDFLSRLYEVPEFRKKSEILLSEGVAYILDKKNNSGAKTQFPSWIKKNEEELQYSGRLAWCYGDLGVGLSLFNVAKRSNNKELFEQACDILIQTSYRKELKINGVEDSGICHGAFGLAQIYQRLFMETKIQDFDKSAQYWLNKGLEMDNGEFDFAGFKQLMGSENNWVGQLNLLTGISGIGLVLLSSLNPKNSNWDECLLLS